MQVQLYSDVVCPHCYLGELKLRQAIKELGQEDITVELKSFLLHPDMPTKGTTLMKEHSKEQYGQDSPYVTGEIQKMVQMGREVGVDFRYDIMKTCNTKNAHRLIKWADKEEKKGMVLNLKFMRAYFTEGQSLNSEALLLNIVKEVGLDREKAKKVLYSKQFLEEVKQDHAEVFNLQIPVVPYMRFLDNTLVTGVQTIEGFKRELRKAKVRLNHNEG